jgi:hypothetical protein
MKTPQGCQILFLDGKDFPCLHIDVLDEADPPGNLLELDVVRSGRGALIRKRSSESTVLSLSFLRWWSFQFVVPAGRKVEFTDHMPG